jgi:hypothetical protein
VNLPDSRKDGQETFGPPYGLVPRASKIDANIVLIQGSNGNSAAGFVFDSLLSWSVNPIASPNRSFTRWLMLWWTAHNEKPHNEWLTIPVISVTASFADTSLTCTRRETMSRAMADRELLIRPPDRESTKNFPACAAFRL